MSHHEHSGYIELDYLSWRRYHHPYFGRSLPQCHLWEHLCHHLKKKKTHDSVIQHSKLTWVQKKNKMQKKCNVLRSQQAQSSLNTRLSGHCCKNAIPSQQLQKQRGQPGTEYCPFSCPTQPLQRSLEGQVVWVSAAVVNVMVDTSVDGEMWGENI